MSPEGPFRPPGEEPDEEAAQPPRRYPIGGQQGGGQQNPYASAQGSQGQSPYAAGSGQASPYAAGSGQSPYAAGSGQQSPYAAGSQPPATPPGSPPAAPPPVAGPAETATGPALGQPPGLWGTPPQQQPPPPPTPPTPPQQPPYSGGSGDGGQGRLWGSPPAPTQQPQPPWAQRIPAAPAHRDPGRPAPPGPPGSPPGNRPTWQPPATPGPLLGEPAAERGRRPLVIGGVLLLVLLLLGGSVGAYLLFKGGGSTDTGKPKVTKPTADTKPCKVSGTDTRPRKPTDCWRSDQLPMTIDEAWPQDAVKVSRTNSTENRVTSKVDTDCGKVVVKELRKVVADAGCRQVIRVTYYDANNKIVASAGVMTVRDRDSAEAVRARASDIADSAPRGVVSPLKPLPGSDATNGSQITETTKGSYLTFAQGHYVIWRFAAYVDKAAQTSVDQKLSDAGGILYLFASNAIGERDKNPNPSTSVTPQPNGGSQTTTSPR
ncbi:MAG: hypothetical protein ACJ73S_26665 [Mycobacteriales bacterium]